jgi:HK97 gp10 family phage protein
MTTVEVKGLSQALKNFQQLDDDVKTNVSRGALREGAWVIARAGRAATYSTFRRISGAIRAGMGVIVQREPTDEEIKAHVVEYPRPGTVRGALGSKSTRQRAKGGVAYWWRFLEKGTGPRRASATPKFLRSGRVTQSGRVAVRQAGALARWANSANRGAISSRAWLRPSFSASVERSIDTFRDEALDRIEKQTNAMPK